MTTKMRFAALAVACAAAAGCSTVNRAVGGAMGGAAGAAGEAAGQRAGAAAAGRVMGPTVPGAPSGMAGAQMMGYYANWMFGLAFHSGGYWVGGAGAGMENAGQWTLWEFQSGGKTQRMERAFLTRLPDGKEWWRVRWYSMEEHPDTVIFEAMFGADRSQVLRMRGKTSGEEAGEIPVEQGTGFVWTRPTELTQESLQGATVGNEAVTTPAGTFQTRHVRYTMMGGGNYEWWMASNVPGGVVKYTAGYHSDSYTVTLVGMGTDARTLIGSY